MKNQARNWHLLWSTLNSFFPFSSQLNGLHNYRTKRIYMDSTKANTHLTLEVSAGRKAIHEHYHAHRSFGEAHALLHPCKLFFYLHSSLFSAALMTARLALVAGCTPMPSTESPEPSHPYSNKARHLSLSPTAGFSFLNSTGLTIYSHWLGGHGKFPWKHCNGVLSLVFVLK